MQSGRVTRWNGLLVSLRCQIHTSTESTQTLHSSSLWHTKTKQQWNNETVCISTVPVEEVTSGNSKMELNIFVLPLSCSGRLRRYFTEPFLNTSNILSLEPERKRLFYFAPTSLLLSIFCFRQSLTLTAPQHSTTAGDGLKEIAGKTEVSLYLDGFISRWKRNNKKKKRSWVMAISRRCFILISLSGKLQKQSWHSLERKPFNPGSSCGCGFIMAVLHLTV